MGLSLEQYWEYTPKKLEKFANVYRQKQENRVKEWDMMNHLLGRYIMYAVNQPKSYPDRPYLEQVEAKKEMTDSEMDRMMMHNTILMGGIIKSKQIQQ